MHKLRAKLARWADSFKLAFLGLGMAMRRWRFWLVVLVVFGLFGTLMGMLAYSSSWAYLGDLPDIGAKFNYLVKMFVTIFWPENWTMLVITILQALIIGMLALTWWKKRRLAQHRDINTSTSGINAGIVTGLAVLAGGCPACGTSLLAPVVGAIFSGSSAAAGETISWVLTLVAILIAILTFRKIGEECYVIIVCERRRLKQDARK